MCILSLIIVFDHVNKMEIAFFYTQTQLTPILKHSIMYMADRKLE